MASNTPPPTGPIAPQPQNQQNGQSSAMPQQSQSSDKDVDPKEKGFFNQPRAGGKSIWDWLDLAAKLAIPLILGIATFFFSLQQADLAKQQHEADQQQTLDQQRQAILVTYEDNMKDLLLNRGLLTSQSNDDIRVIARTETLAAMRQLDGKRNSYLVQFLQDAHLIGFRSGNIVSFEAADLSSDDLSGADLSYTNLQLADLSGANLSHAFLFGTDLSHALLFGTNFYRADLHGANLSAAFLDGANIYAYVPVGHGVSRADESGPAVNLAQYQLDEVYSCTNALLPPGLTCHHNQ